MIALATVSGSVGLWNRRIIAATPSGPTVYADDDFNNTDGTNLTSHTMDVGPGWTAGRGTWQINANRVSTITGGGDNECVAWVECGASDVVLTADVRAGAGGERRLAGNISTADLLWLGYTGGASTFIFQKTGSGAFTSRASGSCTAGTAGTIYPVKLECLGDLIRWTAGGATISYTGSPRAHKTETKHGIHVAHGSTVSYDSFHAESP